MEPRLPHPDGFEKESTRKQAIHPIHVTEDHSWNNTGITRVVDLLARNMTAVGLNQTIISAGDSPIPPPAGVEAVNVPIPSGGLAWRWSPAFASTLRRLLADHPLAVTHLHGLWMSEQWIAARIAHAEGVPFLITPHGMLNHWMNFSQGWARSWQKQLYWRGMAHPVFRHAAVVHAVTRQERENIRKYLPRAQVEIIPNAVDLTEIDAHPHVSGDPDRTLLFIGRIHPIKGVRTLIEAFAQAGLSREWRLLVVGPEEIPEFKAELIRRVSDLGLSERVTFQDPVFDEQKWALYRKAWTVVMPSYSEVIGMVNLESAACETPTITTVATGLEDWTDGGGILIRPEVGELAQALRQATTWDEQERRERGRAARALVEREYSWAVIRQKWHDLYTSLH